MLQTRGLKRYRNGPFALQLQSHASHVYIYVGGAQIVAFLVQTLVHTPAEAAPGGEGIVAIPLDLQSAFPTVSRRVVLERLYGHEQLERKLLSLSGILCGGCW